MRMVTSAGHLLTLVLSVVLLTSPAVAQNSFDSDPINYSTAEVDDPIARLQRRLDAGEVTLDRDERFGYLPAILRELKMPLSSQTLVFSKTSFQRDLISPSNPRAIYFDDDTYIGYIRGGDMLELAATDPRNGTIFYTLDQRETPKPRFVRETESCLQCHGSSMTRDVPGLLVRSVVPDANGEAILTAGTSLVSHETPLDRRWGGWYMTGHHGDQQHMGNTVALKTDDTRGSFDTAAGANLNNFEGRFDTTALPSPHSDAVALMVLAHQAEMHNLLTRASYQTRRALRDERVINEALGRDGTGHSESTLSRIRSAGEPLVRYMLFCNEAELTAPLEGTTTFAADFTARGPRDSKGRSLRDLDLTSRMFRYPCSYLIYSEQFGALPAPVKQYVYERFWKILNEKEKGEDRERFDHLNTDDRDAIREILIQTKPDFAEFARGK